MTDYIFPPDLEKTPIRFMINTRQYLPVSQGAKTLTKDILKSRNNYILPIPQQGINDVFSMMYETQRMDAVGGVMNTLRQAVNDIQAGTVVGAADAAKNIVRGAGEFLSQRAIDAVAKTVGQTVPGVSSGQVKGGIEQILGVVENPNFAALFKGVRLRSHNFQWKFLPRNLTESTLIGNLIRQLQADSLPSPSTLTDKLINTASNGKVQSKGSNFVLGYPDVAFLKIVGPSYDLITFNKDGCFISDIRVAYSDGEVAFFKDKYHPSEISLSIQFQERTIVTKNDFISRATNKNVSGTSPLSDLINSSSDPRTNQNTTSGGRF
jgi:hypothetical protein